MVDFIINFVERCLLNIEFVFKNIVMYIDI